MKKIPAFWMTAVLAALSGCGGEGEWVVETWGEAYIEQEIPADVFADGCSIQYGEFLVLTKERKLLDGDGTVVGEIAPAQVYDMVTPGPTPMGSVTVPADHYSAIEVVIAPDPVGEASVLVDGTLTCGGSDKHFRWSFNDATTYTCEPADLTIPAGGSDDSQITIHGDHLFYDGLENDDAVVRGRAVFDADADSDGEITLAELEAVSVPALGYQVGQFSGVLNLRQFTAHLSRTLAHIDGEGECRVNL